ncbi:MAG: endonuclease/exonuclease/phosphatase family protein [Bacteroidales bacterium]
MLLMIKVIRWIFRYLVLITNVVFATFLVCAYISTEVSAAKSQILPFFGLFYVPILIVNVFFILYWLLFSKKKKFAFVSLFAFLVGISTFLSVFRFSRPLESPQLDLGVLTYNTRMFRDEHHKPVNIESLMDEFAKKKANVYCFQEAIFTKENTVKDALLSFAKITGDKYYYFSDNQRYIITSFLIVGKGAKNFENTPNGYMWVDLKINDDTVRVINSHLQSNSLLLEQYNNTLSEYGLDSDEMKKQALDLGHRLSTGFRKRAEQVDALLAGIEDCPYPVLVCGDFNEPPVSYTHGSITKKTSDSFEKRGRGIGSTYRGKLPFLRIDYVFYSDKMFNPTIYQNLEIGDSDHYPVYVGFELLK